MKTDFTALQAEKILNEEEFDKFFEGLRAIRGSDGGKDYRGACKIIDDKNNDKNAVIANQIMLLSYYIPPTTEVKGKWKPSVPESVDSLIQLASVRSSVDLYYKFLFFIYFFFFLLFHLLQLIINGFFISIIF